MKKLSFLLFVIVFLTSCSHNTQTQEETHQKIDFFDPIHTFEELEAMAGEYDLLNFVNDFEFTAAEPNKRFSQIKDLLWLNGQLLVADMGSTGGGAIHILDKNLNVVDIVRDTQDAPILLPYALALDENENLYVVLGGKKDSGSASFFIAIFDRNLTYKKSIPFTIQSEAEIVMPKSLAIDPKGGFYLTLEAQDKAEDGVIYRISNDGKASDGIGNKSFGYLMILSDSLFFVNGGFPTVYDNITGAYAGQPGLSALYKLQNGTATASIILPPAMFVPYTEKEIEEWIQVYMELNGKEPTVDERNDYIGFGKYMIMTDGAGGFFRLGDNIAVINKMVDVMHVFNGELEYQYSQDLINSYAEQYRSFVINGPSISSNIAACADDKGNIYIAKNLFSKGYAIIKGTPKP